MSHPSAVDVPRLHIVTDDATLARPGFVREATAVLGAGAAHRDGPPLVALHVRGHHTSGRRIQQVVEALVGPADETGALLVVNDRVDVALAVDGVGIQLGRRSLGLDEVRRLVGPNRPVGMSVHAPDVAAGALHGGASWALAGHVFETPSHPGVEGRGTGWLADVVRAAEPLPVLGIGGVSVGRVAEVLGARAAGVAVIGGVWSAPDPADAVLGYIQALIA